MEIGRRMVRGARRGVRAHRFEGLFDSPLSLCGALCATAGCTNCWLIICSAKKGVVGNDRGGERIRTTGIVKVQIGHSQIKQKSTSILRWESEWSKTPWVKVGRIGANEI